MISIKQRVFQLCAGADIMHDVKTFSRIFLNVADDADVRMIATSIPHHDIVSNVQKDTAERFYIVHNIGAGAKLEDALFLWKIIGHYRYENIP